MTPHDKHAQAALIMLIMQTVLSQPECDYVVANYGKRFDQLDSLVVYLIAHLGSGIFNRRALIAIVSGYCGQEIGIDLVREEMGTRHITALELRKKAWTKLDYLHMQIIGSMTTALLKHKLLEVA